MLEVFYNLYASPTSQTLNYLTFDVLKYLLLFTFVSWIVVNKINYYKNIPPGPWGVPFLGYLPFMKHNGAPHSWYLRKSQKYGDVFSVQMGSNLVVCVGSAKIMKELFYRHDSTGRPDTPLNNLLGGFGIILSEGLLWKRQRQFLNEKFRALGIKLTPNQRFEKFVMLELEELLDILSRSNEQPIDPTFVVGRHMHNIICQLMMSFRFEENSEEFKMFNERVTRGMKLYGSVHFGEHVRAYLKLPGKQAVLKEMKRNLEDISKFHADRVTERLNKRITTSECYEPADLLDYYLEKMEIEKKEAECQYEKGNLSSTIFPGTDPVKQIVQVMNDLFSAGMETSRTTLVWCLVMMMRETDVAQKARNDLRRVVGTGRMVTLEHRSQLPYVEAIIFETLRTVSLVPLGTTHVNTREWKIDNYTIPAGAHIVPLINKMNVDPETYPEPYKFKPERYIKNGQLQVSETFAQFGIGQRMCLGTQLARMELFLFFSNLMNHYEFYMPEGHDVPGLEGVLGTTHSPVPFELCFRMIEK